MNKIIILIGKILYFIQSKQQKYIHVFLQEKYYSNIKKIGKCVRFNGVSSISGFNNLEIGNNVHIGDNAHIRAEGGLYIGNNTHISRNLILYTINHNYHGEALPYDNTENEKKVIIEQNVWIGINVTILPGTHIEEGCIIGAGAVIAGRISKLSINGASLAKVINKRDKEHYNKLSQCQQFGGINGTKLPEDCF